MLNTAPTEESSACVSGQVQNVTVRVDRRNGFTTFRWLKYYSRLFFDTLTRQGIDGGCGGGLLYSLL